MQESPLTTDDADVNDDGNHDDDDDHEVDDDDHCRSVFRASRSPPATLLSLPAGGTTLTRPRICTAAASASVSAFAASRLRIRL